MSLVPIISQTWDTTSVFNPTRMNNIETNIATVSDASGVKYSNGVSVKDMIDTKSANLGNGSAYSTYIDSLTRAKAYQSGKVVNISISARTKAVSASAAAWAELFTIPSNISKPADSHTLIVVTSAGDREMIDITSAGKVNILTSNAISASTMTIELTYIAS